MKVFLSVGQTYHHEDEDESFEIVRLTRESATLETEEGAILYMSLEELAEDVENGVLTPTEDEPGDEEEADDD